MGRDYATKAKNGVSWGHLSGTARGQALYLACHNLSVTQPFIPVSKVLISRRTKLYGFLHIFTRNLLALNVRIEFGRRRPNWPGGKSGSIFLHVTR
jgi:hypothetical protein